MFGVVGDVFKVFAQEERLKNQASSSASPQFDENQEKHSSSKVLVPVNWRRRIRAASSVAESFYHAFNGVWLGLRTERNLRIHFIAAASTALLAYLLKVDYLGCLALVAAIGLVLTAEFINTSLEHLVDLASGRTYHVSAKAAKDTAAAAVLMASICACIIGIMVFGPKVLALLHINVNLPR
jgi:diacylglycerol kinase